jgi:hypothetical protein
MSKVVVTTKALEVPAAAWFVTTSTGEAEVTATATAVTAALEVEVAVEAMKVTTVTAALEVEVEVEVEAMTVTTVTAALGVEVEVEAVSARERGTLHVSAARSSRCKPPRRCLSPTRALQTIPYRAIRCRGRWE